MKKKISILAFVLVSVLTAFQFIYAEAILKIICDLDGGEIYIDGKFKTECYKDEPVDILVSPERLKIEVKKYNKDGSYYYFRRNIRVGDGIRTTISVSTEKILTDEYYYKKAVNSGDIEYYEEYLRIYPII